MISIQENIVAIVLVVYSDPNITGRCEIIWSFLAKQVPMQEIIQTVLKNLQEKMIFRYIPTKDIKPKFQEQIMGIEDSDGTCT